MPLPIIEEVALNVLSTVATVTVANGYNFDLTVQRHTCAGDKRTHLNAVIVQDDPRLEPAKVYNTSEWRLEFSIGTFVIPAETDATAIDAYCNLIRSDVEKALMIDRYRGGYALDTTILAPHNDMEGGLEYDCIIVHAEINYRTPDTDPYTNAR